MPAEPTALLEQLGLTKYEQQALAELLTLGRTTAPNLAGATGIPKARIYGVLDSLANRGFIKLVPGRPKEYQPKPPEEILDRAVENRRQEFKQFAHQLAEERETFLEEFQPRYEQASKEITPAEELFYVVDVGDPSERETRRLYNDATEQVYVITNSFAYFESIESTVSDALDCVGVDALFLHPDHLPEKKAARQADIVEHIEGSYPELGMRFSIDRLPWRGTLIDPSLDYDSGEAIFLVEEPNVPDHMRQAAITENSSFVAGLKRYFDLIWEYESVADPDEG